MKHLSRLLCAVFFVSSVSGTASRIDADTSTAMREQAHKTSPIRVHYKAKLILKHPLALDGREDLISECSITNQGSVLLESGALHFSASIYKGGQWTAVPNSLKVDGYSELGARGMSDREDVIGFVCMRQGADPRFAPACKPFVIRSGQMQTIHTPPRKDGGGGTPRIDDVSINQGGDIIASVYDGDNYAWFLPAGRNPNAQYLGGGVARAINNKGQVLIQPHIFPGLVLNDLSVWDNGKVAPVVLPPGSYFSIILGFNNQGEIIIESGDTNNSVLVSKGKIVDVSSGSHHICSCCRLNDNGQAVGTILISGRLGWVDGKATTHAMVYSDGDTVDLNDVTELSDHSVLRSAIAINNMGQIVALGTGGVYLLDPVRG